MPVPVRRALVDGRLPLLRPSLRMPLKASQDTGERAFAYAKACGIIGKSFIGKRISALGKLHSLNELDRLVFPEI